MKTIRDPVHDYISFSSDEQRLVDSPWFQRLRHCSQNGPTRLVYPTLLGTRFEHSLGVMDLATRLLGSVLDRSKYANGTVERFVAACRRDLKLFLGRDNGSEAAVLTDIRTILRATALCHDLGHFPLSHTLERAFEKEFWSGAFPKYMPSRKPHEIVSVEVVRHILESDEGVLDDWVGKGVILVMLSPSSLSVTYRQRDLPFRQTVFSTLNGIIMGDYDADRLDYLQRDGHLSGSGFGRFDVRRFIDAMSLTEVDGGYQVMPTSHALSTIEAALVERYKLYKWVYFHHKTLFFDEVTYEAARAIFRDSATIRKLFRPYDGKANDPLAYLREVLRALAIPGARLPPLVLFGGERLGAAKARRFCLDPKFLVSNRDTHFFDDVWFCRECRDSARWRGRRSFYLHCLVERKACGITAWKDWSQFTRFRTRCRKNGEQSAFLKETTKAADLETEVRAWLERIWGLMKEGDFPDEVSQAFVKLGNAGLKAAGMKGVRLLVRMADWRLFGNLKDKQIIGRTGKLSRLVDDSTLLKELSNLTGEIPFFVFVVGDTAEIAAVKSIRNFSDRLLKCLAEAFMKALVQSWNVKEIRGAWSEKPKEGAGS